MLFKTVTLLFVCNLLLSECAEFSLFRGNLTSNLDELAQIISSPLRSKYYTPHVLDEYDYVIVGSGPAGSVLAHRLSEDSSVTVLLLELGAPEVSLVTDPPFADVYLQGTDFNFKYVTEVQQKACQGCVGRRCPFPHGRGVGGSSIINYMIYTRGNRREYDLWRDLGCPGWGYDDVLPYYIKSEDAYIRDFNNNGFHGHGGYLTVEDVPFRLTFKEPNKSAIDMSITMQRNRLEYMQQTTRNGRRVTSAAAFLDPVKNRKNLHILPYSRVTKLIIDEESKEVKGVQYFHNKMVQYVSARREVILSAGAFESSKLLILSGIGPPEHLYELGIRPVKYLPVGETMYEHMGTLAPIFTFDRTFDNLMNWGTGITLETFLQYIVGQGVITSNGIEGLLYMRTNFSASPDPGLADIEIMQAFTTIAFDTSTAYQQSFRLSEEVFESVFLPLRDIRAMHFLPMLLKPRSKGFMRLKSRNPFHHPLFYPNYFDDDRDIEALVAGIREAIRIGESPPFRRLGARLYEARVPGCNYVFNSHEYWRCYVQTIAATFHHQVATCKMGSELDPTTVVDHRLRVHGIKHLRVADVGIIPVPASGHTVAYSYMIGEKAADMIKQDWHNHVYSNEPTYYTNAERPIYRFARGLGNSESVAFDWQKAAEEAVDESRVREVTLKPHQVTKEPQETTTANVHNSAVSAEEESYDIRSLLRATDDEIKVSKQLIRKSISVENVSSPTTNSTTEETSLDDKVSFIHPPELLSEYLPTASEDGIRMITLANGTKYGKGDAKPREITLKLAEMETQEYNAADHKNILEEEMLLQNNSDATNITKDAEIMSVSVTSTVSMKMPKHESERQVNRQRRFVEKEDMDLLRGVGKRLERTWDRLNEGTLKLGEAVQGFMDKEIPKYRKRRAIHTNSKKDASQLYRDVWSEISNIVKSISGVIKQMLSKSSNNPEINIVLTNINSTWTTIINDSDEIETILSKIIDCKHCTFDDNIKDMLGKRLNKLIENFIRINILISQTELLEQEQDRSQNLPETYQDRAKRRLMNSTIQNLLESTQLIGSLWQIYNNGTDVFKNLVLNIAKLKLSGT